MNKAFKRVLAVLLIVPLLLSGVFVAFAAPDHVMEQTQITYGNKADLQGASGFGGALANMMADKEDPDTSCNIVDAQIEGKTAHVMMKTDRVCKLIVAVYEEQSGQMLGSGIKNVEVDTKETDVVVTINVMPQFFLLKAFLLDENNAALCKEFINYTYAKAFAEFKEKTVEDFPGNLVVNFDESAEDNFAVLQTGAVQTKTTHVMAHNAQAGTYILTKIDDNVRSLETGDVLCLQEYGEIRVLKIKSIAVSGNVATVVEEPDTEISDLFSYVDYDQSSSPTGNDVVYDPSGLSDGVMYKGMEPWNTPADQNMVAAQTEFLDVDENLKRACPVLETPDWYPIGSSDSTLNVKVKLSLKITVNINLKLYFDGSWSRKWRVDIWNNMKKDFMIFQLKYETKLTGSFAVTGKLQHDFDLGKIGIRFKAGVVEIPIVFHVEANAAATVSVDFITFPLGIRYDDNVGWQNLCAIPTFNLYPKFELTSEICFSIKPAAKLTLVELVSVEMEVEMGVRFHTTHLEIDFAVLNGKKIPDKIHLCDWWKCAPGEFQHYTKMRFKGLLFEKTVIERDLDVEQYGKLADYCVQFDPFHLYWGVKCPNMAYRVDYTVVNKKGKPIFNLDVHSGAPDLGKTYRFNELNATDKDGKVYFFYTPGDTSLSLIDPHLPTQSKDYTAEFLLNGITVASKKITMIGENISLTVTIDTDKEDGGGSGHHDYTGLAPATSDGVGSDDTILTEPLKKGQIIQLGAYPQTEIKLASHPVLWNSLNSTLKALEKDDPDIWHSYGYFSDGQSSDFMQFVDVYYSGSKYRAVTFSQYRPFSLLSESSSTWSWQDDSGYNPHKVYWFKYEPMRWVVLDPNTGLLVSETIIDAQPFNNYLQSSGKDEYGNNACWGDVTKTYYSNNYAESTIRQWLNDSFYNTAFTAKQSGKLDAPSIENKAIESHSAYGSIETADPVFLLSLREVANPSLFSDNSARRAHGSDYSKCQGLYPSLFNHLDTYSWSLRTAGDYSYAICWVSDGGSEYAITGDGNVGSSEVFGIRPAIQLNLPSAIVKSSKKADLRTSAQSEGADTAASGGAIVGNEYVLLVRKAGTTGLTSDNLLYIDQQTASDGKLVFGYVPRTSETATVEIVGDFGAGIETHVIQISVVVQDREETAHQTFKLNPEVQANGVAYSLNYVSSNPKVATVDDNGNVTTHKRGKATITVIVMDEFGHGISKNCTVTVKYSWLQWLIVILLFGWIWYK